MNDDRNGERTDIERDVNERMRELGRRSGEARRRNAKAKHTDELELTDREQAMAALRRALDGGNMAAMVAAAKALLEFDHSPRERPVTVEEAREHLEAREYETLVDLVGRWIDAECDRLTRGRRARLRLVSVDGDGRNQGSGRAGERRGSEVSALAGHQKTSSRMLRSPRLRWLSHGIGA